MKEKPKKVRKNKKHTLKLLINKILVYGFGYKLQRFYPKLKFARLPELGFHPHTIVDIGVGYGTPEFYKVFPKSYYVLIEPLIEFEPNLQKILRMYNGQYFLNAVGDKKEKRIINFEPIILQKSSFYNRTELSATSNSIKKREILVTTLDTLLKEHSLQPPFGLKIDAEGAELEVIKGASKFLRKTEFVIAEVNVAKRFEQSYSFVDFINIMNDNNFRLCDIIEISHREYPKEIKYLDMVFKNEDL